MPDLPKTSDDYIIGPGDALQIFVWRNPELTVSVAVRPDGKISTPLVENMVAVGKSPSQLARDIEVVLSEFVREPQVNVILGAAVSTYSQVKVVGEVRTPQAMPFREGLKVLDIVLAAGGLTEFASANRARIVRLVDGKNVETKREAGRSPEQRGPAPERGTQARRRADHSAINVLMDRIQTGNRP